MKTLTLLILIILSTSLFAQDKTSWKGFTRYDFKFENQDTRLVVPNKALTGNPWIWRARFPGWHTETDSILVAEGFHLVYINTNNTYGSPETVKQWNRLYSYMTTNYNLNNKVALMGVSRGGLFIYNWAKSNPEKVSCIYAEAPVCDFKSWPGGFGNGKGSINDWNTLKKIYGFANDEEAKSYQNNPIDNLEQLAKAKVPLLHMIGLNDNIVPPAENSLVLINRYIKLGGIAIIVPCTEGKQNLEGHHFPIETPRYVADFIKYHTLQNSNLEASNYHNIKDGLPNCRIKFEREKVGRVAFLGGSITYNGGWRDSVSQYLQKRFPETKFEFIAAGIPSMGTTSAAFRLERDVLSKGKIDLLFEEAAVNDPGIGHSSVEQVRAMEGIVRHLRTINPEMDIVMMHFVDPDKMKTYRNGEIPEVITNHNKVATHYNIPTINLAKEVTERIDNKEFTWKDDFRNLHPSPFGQGVYARSMITLLDNAFCSHLASDDKMTAYTLPNKFDKYCYDKGAFIDISQAKLGKGWSIIQNWKPTDGTGSRDNFRNVPMLVNTETESSLKLSFTGSAVGIAVAAGQDAGIIEYRIDKQEWQELNIFTKWSKSLHLPRFYTLASTLNNGKHVLDLRVKDTHDARSKGNVCRIRYFYVN